METGPTVLRCAHQSLLPPSHLRNRPTSTSPTFPLPIPSPPRSQNVHPTAAVNLLSPPIVSRTFSCGLFRCCWWWRAPRGCGGRRGPRARALRFRRVPGMPGLAGSGKLVTGGASACGFPPPAGTQAHDIHPGGDGAAAPLAIVPHRAVSPDGLPAVRQACHLPTGRIKHAQLAPLAPGDGMLRSCPAVRLTFAACGAKLLRGRERKRGSLSRDCSYRLAVAVREWLRPPGKV